MARIGTVEGDRAGAGAVFIADRDGGLEVFVDEVGAGDYLEVIDIEDGEHPSAYRVDGAVLELLDDDGLVVVDLSGEVDAAGLQALIDRHAHEVATGLDSASPLDFAEGWLREEWERARSRRLRWWPRRANPPCPPTRAELAAPPGPPSPRLSRPQLVRDVVKEVLGALPEGAVVITKGVERGAATIHLRPRAAGAVDVLLRHRLSGVDICIAGSAPIEVAAPDNTNYGPPHRPWRDDVRDVLRAVSHGLVVLALDSTGAAVTVELPGGRLGVTSGRRPRHPVRRPAAWDGPPAT